MTTLSSATGLTSDAALDISRLIRLERDVADAELLTALLHGFVARVQGRLLNLDEAVESGHAGRIDDSCRELAQPALMLGMDPLHQSLLELLAASRHGEKHHAMQPLRRVHRRAEEARTAVVHWLTHRVGHELDRD